MKSISNELLGIIVDGFTTTFKRLGGESFHAVTISSKNQGSFDESPVDLIFVFKIGKTKKQVHFPNQEEMFKFLFLPQDGLNYFFSGTVPNYEEINIPNVGDDETQNEVIKNAFSVLYNGEDYLSTSEKEIKIVRNRDQKDTRIMTVRFVFNTSEEWAFTEIS